MLGNLPWLLAFRLNYRTRINMWYHFGSTVHNLPRSLQIPSGASSPVIFPACILPFTDTWSNILITFLPDNGFYAVRTPTAYTTKMKLCAPDELGILQHISEWARTTNHPWCSHVLTLRFLRMNNHQFHLRNICYDNCLRISISFTTNATESNLANLNWTPKSVVRLWHTAK